MLKLGLWIAARIDKISETIGRLVAWTALLMVLIGAFNAVARYVSRDAGFNLSSNAFIELQWYLFSALFLLGGAYTLKHGGHVRVDVFYGRLSPRNQAWINLAGAIVFLLPFCLLMIWVTVPAAVNSWSIGEQSPDPGGLPRYPIKALIPAAFLLLLAQGVAEAVKQAAKLRGALPMEPDESEENIGL